MANFLSTIAAIGNKIVALKNSMLQKSELGVTVAPLVNGKVPNQYLNQQISEVQEFENVAAFPETGTANVIYIDLSTIDDHTQPSQYLWGGTSYHALYKTPANTDAIPEGTENLYYTPARVAAAIASSSPVLSVAGLVGTITVNALKTALAYSVNDIAGLADLLNSKVSTTGLGATGTWDISISGNAATASSANGLNPSGQFQVDSLGVGTPPPATSGEVRVVGDVVTFYSDERLKDIIGTIEDALLKIDSLDVIRYRANDLAFSYGFETDTVQVGLRAGQVKDVLPEATAPAPFDIARDIAGNEYSSSGKDYLTVKYGRIVPLLVKGIQEQNILIRDLLNAREQMTADIQNLNNRLSSVESRSQAY